MFKSNSKEKTLAIGIWGRTANQLQKTDGTTISANPCCELQTTEPSEEFYLPPCCVEAFRKESKQFNIGGSVIGNSFPWKRTKKPS